MPQIDKKHRIYPHIHKGRFYNHPTERKPSFLIPSLHMLLDWHLNKRAMPKHELNKWLEFCEPLPASQNLAITWVGHSTFLIQVNGYNILTDPIFGDLTPLFRRITPAGISLEKLPSIDFVILSHNHWDHMDSVALTFLAKNNPEVTFLVPQGDGVWFRRRGIHRVRESSWWNAHSFGTLGSLTFTFLPACHWSQRGLLDFNRSLWGSWMIECAGKRLYFAGDTAYSHHFNAIAQEFSAIDIALMPIGPCEPRAWMSHSHVSAEEAGQAFLDLNARHFIPMHWGAYYFGLDSFDLPCTRLKDWWSKQPLIGKELSLLKVGQRIMPLSDQPSIHPSIAPVTQELQAL
jgi:L-ascorbate metabolism protein UlaG (beta-lactamase superfamily)